MIRLALVLLLVLACDDERPPPDRTAPLASQAAPPSARSADPLKRPRPDPRVTPSTPFVPRPREERVVVETPGRPGTPAPTESPLSAELRAAAGTPAGCGDVPPLEGELRIPLRAVVGGNGFVVSASVGGSLPSAVRECMADRIERHRFAAAQGGPPRSVSAELVLGARQTMVEQTTTREERVGWGTGFDLQGGQTAIGGGQARELAPAAGAREIAPASGAREIAPPPSQAIGGPSGVSITGPTGRAIGE